MKIESLRITDPIDAAWAVGAGFYRCPNTDCDSVDGTKRLRVTTTDADGNRVAVEDDYAFATQGPSSVHITPDHDEYERWKDVRWCAACGTELVNA